MSDGIPKPRGVVEFLVDSGVARPSYQNLLSSVAPIFLLEVQTQIQFNATDARALPRAGDFRYQQQQNNLIRRSDFQLTTKYYT